MDHIWYWTGGILKRQSLRGTLRRLGMALRRRAMLSGCAFEPATPPPKSVILTIFNI
jgi:hypothetical protein